MPKKSLAILLSAVALGLCSCAAELPPDKELPTYHRPLLSSSASVSPSVTTTTVASTSTTQPTSTTAAPTTAATTTTIAQAGPIRSIKVALPDGWQYFSEELDDYAFYKSSCNGMVFILDDHADAASAFNMADTIKQKRSASEELARTLIGEVKEYTVGNGIPAYGISYFNDDPQGKSVERQIFFTIGTQLLKISFSVSEGEFAAMEDDMAQILAGFSYK